MISYAAKRIVRGRGLFLALFMSVVLAATLFSGILQGADAVGVSLLDSTLKAANVDVTCTAAEKNVTVTRVYEADMLFGKIDGVKRVNHLIRMKIDLNSSASNVTITSILLVLPDDSDLLKEASGAISLENSKIHIEAASTNATMFPEGETATVSFETYKPYGDLMDFKKLYFNFQVAEPVALDDKNFAIATGRYNEYLLSVLTGTEDVARRPPYQLVLMSESTFKDMLAPIYGELRRRPVDDLANVALITLDRERIINPWDMQGSLDRLTKIYEQLNGEGARYFYVPYIHIADVLDFISSQVSAEIKTSTLLVSIPVFFTAWYLGSTVSDIVLAQRRREIGLLFTRGLTHRQILVIFLFEAFIVSVFAGLAGVVLGALIVPLAIPGLSALQVLASISPVTLGASMLFSAALALLAVYRPSKRATEIEVVDALREYRAEEERLGSWLEPLIAALQGTYKLVMLIMGVSVESYSPASADMVTQILYSTWWGMDYLLSFIWTILLFWGVTKLFLMYVPWFQGLFARLAGTFAGDASRIVALSSRRNLKRTAASTFMAALIICYGVTVIGNAASSNDFIERAVKVSVGADASVWLFNSKGAEALTSQITGLGGVSSATVETWFTAEISLGVVPVRAIDPLKWAGIAYQEPGWYDQRAFENMTGQTTVLMERGAANNRGIKLGGSYAVKVGTRVISLKVVGFFGRDMGDLWSVQNPTFYVPKSFLDYVEEKYITQTRILVKLKDGADPVAFKTAVEALSPNVQKVDITSLYSEKTINNIFLAGPRRVEELGIYFSSLVASVGVLLVVSTILRSRWKELTLMTIRGFSPRQLEASLLLENVGMSLFAAALGVAIGFVALKGEAQVFNMVVPTMLQRQVVFPMASTINLLLVIAVLLAATVAPILVAVRRITDKPSWKTEE